MNCIQRRINIINTRYYKWTLGIEKVHDGKCNVMVNNGNMSTLFNRIDPNTHIFIKTSKCIYDITKLVLVAASRAMCTLVK